MGLTAEFAERVATTPSGEIPEAALHEAERALLDCVGVSVAALHEPVTAQITAYAGRIGGTPKATVIGQVTRTSPPLAALANGAMAHVLDLDDTTPAICGHPSVVLVPAILAVAEDVGAGGADVLAAYVLGFDVASRLARILNPEHYNRGWHSTGTLLGVGAAAAAARVLGLAADRTTMALGIAASLVSGLRQNFGTMTKALHAGRAAENGVVAALLAAEGWTADRSALEGPVGFLHLYDGRSERRADWSAPGADDWEILSAGIGYKQFPSCGMTHAGIEAMLELRSRHGLRPEAVAAVTATVTPPVPSVLMHLDPQTGLEGKFSLNYCVAIALAEGRVEPVHFTDQGFAAAAIARALVPKVRLEVDPSLPVPPDFPASCPTVLSVRLHDGRVLTKRVDCPLGQPGNPLPDSALEAKFRACVAPVYGPNRAEQLLEQWHALRRAPDARGLMALLTQPAVAAREGESR